MIVGVVVNYAAWVALEYVSYLSIKRQGCAPLFTHLYSDLATRLDSALRLIFYGYKKQSPHYYTSKSRHGPNCAHIRGDAHVYIPSQIHIHPTLTQEAAGIQTLDSPLIRSKIK
jgi:hypothetical protein